MPLLHGRVPVHLTLAELEKLRWHVIKGRNAPGILSMGGI